MNSLITAQPGLLPAEPRLSVCMIVCDEEMMLPRCLKSVQDVADELIIVDTGSRDNTISIAKDFGAKVFRFQWCDDFSAARNESLKHATRDWILQMDADEELLASSIPHLTDCMLRSTVLEYMIRCDNGTTSVGVRYSRLSRLFRRHPALRYERSYHEGLDSSLEDLKRADPRWRVEYEPRIVIRHYGYERSKMPQKWKRGLSIMKSYVDSNPHDSYILTKLGGVCYNLGRHDEAEEYLNKALDMDPGWSETNYNLAVTLHKQKKLEAAIRCYRKAIDRDPVLAEAYANLGAVYIQKGMLDNAIEELKTALAIDPELASAYRHLALAYQNKGMLDESIAESKKAIAIDREIASAHMNLAMAYAKKGMLDDSIAEYNVALALEPEDAKAHTNLGVTYEEAGRFDKAISLHKRAIEIDPLLTSAFVNLGSVYHRKGMFDEAIAQYEAVLRIDANDAEAHHNLAIAYYETANYKEAISHCDRAVELEANVAPDFLELLGPHRG